MSSRSSKAASDAKILDQEYTSAVELLHQIIPQDELHAYSLHHSPTTVYTTRDTLDAHFSANWWRPHEVLGD